MVEVKLYSGTQQMLAHGEMSPKAHRVTLTALHRQVELVRAEYAKRFRRYEKAEAQGDAEMMDKARKGMLLSFSQLEMLNREITNRTRRV